MFKFLKEKFTSWVGKDKEKPKVEEPEKKETFEKQTKKKTEPSKSSKQESKKVEKKQPENKIKEDKKTEEVTSPKTTSIEVKEVKHSEGVVNDIALNTPESKVEEKKEIKISPEKTSKTLSEVIASKEVESATPIELENKIEAKEELIASESPSPFPKIKTEKKSFFAKIKEKFISEEAKIETPKPIESDNYSPPEMVYADTSKSQTKEIEIASPTVLEPEKSEETLKVEEAPPEGFFSKLKQKLTTSELKKEEFEELFQEMEITLLENNVALEVVDKIRDSLAKDLVGIQVKKSEADNKILSSLKSAISQVLIESPSLIETIKSHQGKFVILFFGINGTGKTTSIAKLAWKLKQEGLSVVLAAGDTFRAASIEQLETHAEKIGVPIVKSEYGKDPSAVAFDAIKYAEKNKIKVVLIDTAGRMYTQGNLMREMEKIVKVSQPNMKIFVGESITGNDALDQARSFNETAGIDGIILSKADVDDKAGTILSVSYITQKPILFLGVGQEYKDLQVFSKARVLEGLGLE